MAVVPVLCLQGISVSRVGGAMRPTGSKVTVQRQLRLAFQAYIVGILLTLLTVLIALSGTGRGDGEAIVWTGAAVRIALWVYNNLGLWRRFLPSTAGGISIPPRVR